MLKKIIQSILFIFVLNTSVQAADLLQVYHDAMQSDPIYQQALAQQLSTEEGVPISLASLLPNASANVVPFVSRTTASGNAAGSSSLPDGSTVTNSGSSHGYGVTLTITQTVFDFSKFANLSGARQTAKQAQATLNSDTQDLMIRVVKAYLAVLEDDDILRSTTSTRDAYKKQLDQVKEQQKVGLKTITAVYTARASYQNTVADYIASQNTLANDKENLRALTGKLYPRLAKLKEKFPLISPRPSNIEA